MHHCRTHLLCQVLQALGKAYKTLGKGFVEYSQQRSLGELYIGNDFFVEYVISCLANKSQRHGDK
jgi:hypothetical protein